MILNQILNIINREGGETMKTTGEKIKELRESRGMTLQQLAEMLDLKSYTTVSKWESDENHPRGKEIKLLCKIFNVSADYLLGLSYIEDIGWTIKEERKEQDLSIEELANGVNISPKMLTGIEDDLIPLTSEQLEAITNFFSMTVQDFLIKYEMYDEAIPQYFKGDINAYIKFKEAEEMDAKGETIENVTPTNLIPVEPNFVKIPILGVIACGDPILAEENIEGYTYEFAEYLPSGEIFALKAKGDSMEPTIMNGSKVLVRAQPDVENGEIAAVLVNGDEEATLKRVKKQDGIIFLMPDNLSHKPIIVSPSNPARIIGKVVRSIIDFD